MTASGAGEGSSRCLGTTLSDIWVMVLIVCSYIWPASVDKIISSVYVRQCILLYKWVHLAVEKPCSGTSPRSNGQSQTWTFVIVTQNCPRVTEKAANIICIYLLAYTCVRIHTLEVHSLFVCFMQFWQFITLQCKIRICTQTNTCVRVYTCGISLAYITFKLLLIWHYYL